MSDTPTPRVGEQIVYLLDDTMNEVEAVPAEFARQLERELAELKDKFDGGQMAHAATLADLRDCKEQLAETSSDYRCLAELLDGHDATECRANLVKLKADFAAAKTREKRAVEQRDAAKNTRAELLRHLDSARENERKAQVQLILAQQMHEAERALADRLATWAQEHRNAYMGQVPHQDCGCGDCQILPVLDADLTAWKEARK